MGRLIRQRIKFAFAISLILVTGAVGVTLGTWQVERLAWKNDVIAQLKNAYNEPQEINLTQLKNDNPDYLYGQIEGTFDYSKEIFLGPVTQNQVVSQQVITALNTGGETVLVVRGYVPLEEIDSYSAPNTTTRASVRGLMRKPTWNNFTSANSPAQNIWVRPDIAEIASYLEIDNVSPYLLFADQVTPNDGRLFVPTQLWYPRNKHTQYAAFWFGMSGVLVLFFGLLFFYHRKN